MAEINYNTMFDQLTDLEKQQYEGVMGMGGFKSNYEKNPNSPLVTQNPNYEKFKAIADTQAQVPEKGILSALNPFSSASASEVTPGSYGLQINNAPGIFDINQVGDPALNPNSVNVFGLDPYGVNEDLIDRGNPTGDPRVVSEEQGLSGGFVPTNRPNMRDIAGDINLNMTDLGNPFNDSRVVSEEQGLVGGIPDRGRGMPGTMGAYEMIGGTPVAVGDVLGRQQALEKADFFEPSKPAIDIGGLLSLIGLVTQSRPIQAMSMFANRDKIGAGLSSLGSKLADFRERTTGYRTQAGYDQARANRQLNNRLDYMTKRKAAGKSYSKKNLAKVQAQINERINRDERSALGDRNRSVDYGVTGGPTRTDIDVADGGAESGGRGKIVCTMMNERYGFGSFRNKIWMKFHEHHGPEYQKGYHAIFLPLVKIAKGEGKINTAVRKVLEHMGRHVTADMFKIMKGKKRDTLGRIYRAIFEPACHIIGKIKSALGRG